MKLLYLPLNYDNPQAGTIRAFEGILGKENVSIFDYLEKSRNKISNREINQSFLNQIITENYDWVHLQLQDTQIIQADVISEIKQRNPKIIITHWTGDIRPNMSEYLSSICRVCDITLISSEGQIEMFYNAGAKEVRYWQIGFEDINPVQTKPLGFQIPEIVFCGNHYDNCFPASQERLNLMEVLKKQFGSRFGVIGNYPGAVGKCHLREQQFVYRQAKIVININHFNDIPRYYSDRQFETVGSGTATVCKYVPRLELDFEDGVECLFFRTIDECIDKIKFLLNNEEVRIEMGYKGRARVLKDHTFFSRVLELVPIIERRLKCY